MRALWTVGILLALGTSSALAETFTVASQVVSDEKAVFATVESRNVEPARARIGGTVVALAVKQGDEVTEGQVVATVADEKLLLQIKSLDAQIAGLEAQLAQAELGALKMQLQPHFLFNTLNAIAALLRPAPEAAERMILELAEFLRLTLQNTGRAEVTLREELDFLERYLAIEKIRFGDRLRARFRIRSEVLDARVPNLLLQPLVENAIRHGIARDLAAGRVEVSATHDEDRLLVRVTDDGPGVGRTPVREGIGLSNTRERLRHLFGDDFTFEYGNAPGGGFTVALALPFVAEPASVDGGAVVRGGLSPVAYGF